jgi:hypothetical protein
MTAEILDWTIEEKDGKKYVKVAIFAQLTSIDDVDIASTMIFQTIDLDSRMCDDLLFETWGNLWYKGETNLLFPEWIKSIDRNAMIESMATPTPSPDESTPDLPF